MKLRVAGSTLTIIFLLCGAVAMAATTSTAAKKHAHASSYATTYTTSHRSEHATVSRAKASQPGTRAAGRTSARTASAVVYRHGRRVVVSRHVAYEPQSSVSSFNPNLTSGDVVEGEDPVVRAAAIEALGNMNGTALAIDPSNGRILAMVNQKLALSAGAEPCSTIKVAVALAGLKEGLITPEMQVNLGGRYSENLTHALAHSVNAYFEVLGRALGFERIKHYANEFGLGELAGYNIAGEQLGVYPDHELPAADGGVGRMCSFGESISMTPMQLGALVSAIANGGTLYYLQHPTTQAEAAVFQPQVKRVLDIQSVIPQVMPGMLGAVDFADGTARSLRSNFVEFPVLGKTGTCSNNGTHYGWFVSYGNSPTGKIVTVIFLNGARGMAGPKAAELTGEFYRAMQERNYFAPKPAESVPLQTAGGQ